MLLVCLHYIQYARRIICLTVCIHPFFNPFLTRCHPAEAFADKVELRILHLLRETIDQSAREFAVTKDEIRFVKESYENTLVEHRDVLEKAIEAYWSEIGIDENPFAADDSSHGGD